MTNPEKFLPEKYTDLPGSKPVERAVQKNLRTGEKGPTSKEGRVEAYLERLNHIVEDERGWELLKHKLVKEFAIDTDDPDALAKIAHGLYESEKKLAIEQGRGTDVERLEQDVEHEGGVIERYKGLVQEKRDIQEKTLASWLDYLKQNDAEYPMWFRYFIVRNLQKMGTIEKERGEYTKRTDYTVAPFPELNSEALGFVYRMLAEGMRTDEFMHAGMTEEELKEVRRKQERLANLITKKDFVKLYTFAQIETAGRLNKEFIEGQWVKYPQRSDHHVLENALRGKGTGWCTAEGSAYAHLQGGDFYVYYSKGVSGTFTEPRIAIRMEGDQVAEVRGVNHRQELEPSLVDLAQTQYRSLPGGEKFDKKSADMKKMTELVNKQEKSLQFSKDDLIFLYEVNTQIEGFGYEKDPRIQELRSQRNPKADAPVVLECRPEEIAWSQKDISGQTRSYIGHLFPGIFETDIEHIYTTFPEAPIRKFGLEIGGRNAKDLQQDLKKNQINTPDYAGDMMLKSEDFTTLKNPEEITLVRLKVRDFFSDEKPHTTDQIYQRAAELGLELCPAEVGPHLRLKYTDQPIGEWIYIGMKQITDRGGNPSVFGLGRDGDGLRLDDRWAHPGNQWNPGNQFVFRLRPPKAGK